MGSCRDKGGMSATTLRSVLFMASALRALGISPASVPKPGVPHPSVARDPQDEWNTSPHARLLGASFGDFVLDLEPSRAVRGWSSSELEQKPLTRHHLAF